MNNEQSEGKAAGLNHLSNTSQCIIQDTQTPIKFQQQSALKYSHKVISALSQTNGFNSYKGNKQSIPIYNKQQAKNYPNINNLSIDSETLNKNRQKNVEEQYTELYRDIAIPENYPNKNDHRQYITKERQPDKGLFDDANGFNVQRFLKRVAEEKLYGAFMQSLKNNDMQGQALNTQRRAQYSLYSPQKSNSSYESNCGNQYLSSSNVSPKQNFKANQSYGLESYNSSTRFDSLMNKTISSKRPYSTNQRQTGESNLNSTLYYHQNESLTVRDQQFPHLQSKSKLNKNRIDLSNRSFYGTTGTTATATPLYPLSEMMTYKRLGQTAHSQRESTPLDDKRTDTPQTNRKAGIFVSAPLTSQLKRRVRQYSVQGEYVEQMNGLSPPSRNNLNQSIQVYSNNAQTERKINSAIKNNYCATEIKKHPANVSLDFDGEYDNMAEDNGMRIKHALAKSLAASPVDKRNEEGPYSAMMKRQSSMKKSKNSQMGNTITSDIMKHTKQNFSTLKKKNDQSSPLKQMSDQEWREKSISQQFKIIQDQGSLKENNSHHNHHIRVNHKDQGLHQVFRKISNTQGSSYITNIRTNRGNFRTYLQKRYNDGLVEKLITFLEIPSKVDYMSYVRLIEKLVNLTPKQKILLCFIFLDGNEDGYICNSDVFSFLQKNQNKLTEIDIKNISRFAQTGLNDFAQYSNEENELEKVLIKKSGLTLTEYKLFKKKGVDCLIPTTVKKDTLYHASFQIIEHSNKYRQTVRQLEETKRNQLLDLRKNQNRTCQYQKDAFFCINFDQFEMHVSQLPHLPYIFFDILAYMSLIQFSYVDYINYDRNYYTTFQNYKSEQVEFKSAYSRLLKQHEETMIEMELSQKVQKPQPHAYIEKVNIPQKSSLNKSLTHRTTPIHSNDKSQDFNGKSN